MHLVVALAHRLLVAVRDKIPWRFTRFHWPAGLPEEHVTMQHVMPGIDHADRHAFLGGPPILQQLG